MDELKRIKKIISDQFNGHPWLDVNIVDTLKHLSSTQAAEKTGNLNSIWQIVNHMIEWREVLWKKLNGDTVFVTESNFIEEIDDSSEKEWKQTLKRFEQSQKNIMNFLSKEKNFDYEKVFSNGHTSYEHLQAILQHDAYHLGQIVLLKKLINC